MLRNQQLVELLANVRGRGTAARRSDIDTGDVKSGPQCLFYIVAMREIAKPIVDSQPKWKFPDPTLLRIDGADGFNKVRDSISHAQFD